MSKYTAEQVRACILAYKNGDLNYCRSGIVDLLTEYAAILDAEGNGGAVGEAVAWQYRILDDEEGPSPYWRDMTHQQFEMFRAAARPRYELRQLYTRPARSGVVRDEEMNRCERLLTACTCHADFKGRDMVDPQCRACGLGVEVIDTFRSMRAALAHPTRDAERLKEIVRRAEKITGSRCVRFEVRFDPLSGQGLNLIDYIDAAIEHFAKGSSEDVRDAPELFSGTKDALSNLSIHKSYQEKTSRVAHMGTLSVAAISAQK